MYNPKAGIRCTIHLGKIILKLIRIHNKIFRYGHDRIVLLLLKKGANSILTDKDGYSPLHLAVESQNLVSLKLLLADIRAKLTPSGTFKISLTNELLFQ